MVGDKKNLSTLLAPCAGNHMKYHGHPLISLTKSHKCRALIYLCVSDQISFNTNSLVAGQIHFLSDFVSYW